MKIEQLDLTVQELVEDYDDAGESGVTGYGGKLDIRPPFQREFIYNDKERNAVMYWSDRENGEFEIIDGQQRTISIAQYVDGDFSSVTGKNPHDNQTAPRQTIWKKTRNHVTFPCHTWILHVTVTLQTSQAQNVRLTQ